MQVRL